MGQKVSDEHVWYWHKHCEKQMELGISIKDYAEQFNVEYKRFSNMRYKIFYKKYSGPEDYKKILKQAKEYLASGEHIGKFSSSRKINPRIISEMVTHLKYQERIERLTKESEEPQMNFVQVAKQPQEVQQSTEAELMEKQNDIEIIISKGVKVSIAPNIDSMKIIKIIELLKDL